MVNPKLLLDAAAAAAAVAVAVVDEAKADDVVAKAAVVPLPPPLVMTVACWDPVDGLDVVDVDVGDVVCCCWSCG